MTDEEKSVESLNEAASALEKARETGDAAIIREAKNNLLQKKLDMFEVSTPESAEPSDFSFKLKAIDNRVAMTWGVDEETREVDCPEVIIEAVHALYEKSGWQVAAHEFSDGVLVFARPSHLTSMFSDMVERLGRKG